MKLNRAELQVYVRSAMLRARLNQTIVAIEVSDRYYVYNTLVPRIRRNEGFKDVVAVIPKGNPELWLMPKEIEEAICG